MAEYAIIKTGGKQYRVQAGDVIDVELLDSVKNGLVEFKEVLLFHNGREAKMGSPVLANATVHAELVDEVRGPKVFSYKYKRRKNYHRKVGHRQNYMRVKITSFAV